MARHGSGGSDKPKTRRKGFPWAALDRVLAHAEAHGDVYDGASADHAELRAAMSDSGEAESELGEAAASELEDNARAAEESARERTDDEA